MNLNYSKEEFVRLLIYKGNLIRDNKQTLLEKYSSREKYEQFLHDTRDLLNTEAPIFILDDDYIDKVQTIISELRFEYRDSNLNALANEIISDLNGLSILSLEQQNEIIDKYICMHEDVREVKFINLKDFIDTIAQDVDFYFALLTHDIASIDSVIFISSTNYFLVALPSLYEDKNIADTTKARAEQIKKTPGIKEYSKRRCAKRTISYLEQINN